jgi:hypothetical protein
MPDTIDVNLADYRWKHRLLVVFTPGQAAEAYQDQRERLAGTGGAFRERDLLLITVPSAGTGTLAPSPDTAATPTTEEATDRLRERFSVAPGDFAVILVGKDGTEKRRDHAPVGPQAIFDAIDAMPMRQREMQENGQCGG